MRLYQISTSDREHNNYVVDFSSSDLSEVYSQVQRAIYNAEGELAHWVYKTGKDYFEVVIDAMEFDDDGDWLSSECLDVIPVKKGYKTTFNAADHTWAAELID